jgi:hypothetical protein
MLAVRCVQKLLQNSVHIQLQFSLNVSSMQLTDSYDNTMILLVCAV